MIITCACGTVRSVMRKKMMATSASAPTTKISMVSPLQWDDEKAESVALHHLRVGAGGKIARQRARFPVLAGEQDDAVFVLFHGLQHAHALADDGFGVGGEAPDAAAADDARDHRQL